MSKRPVGGAARLEIPDMPAFPRMSHAAGQTRASVFGQVEASKVFKIRGAIPNQYHSKSDFSIHVGVQQKQNGDSQLNSLFYVIIKSIIRKLPSVRIRNQQMCLGTMCHIVSGCNSSS